MGIILIHELNLFEQVYRKHDNPNGEQDALRPVCKRHDLDGNALEPGAGQDEAVRGGAGNGLYPAAGGPGMERDRSPELVPGREPQPGV